MAGYLGHKPTFAKYAVDELVSDGSATYDLSQAPGNKNNIMVSAGGLVQHPSSYSVTGSVLTLSGVASGQRVIIRHMNDEILYPALDDDAVTSAKIAAGAVGNTDIADNAVTGGKLDISLVAGDTMYASGTDTLAKLAKGTAAQVFTMNAGATAPEWAAAAGGGITEADWWRLTSDITNTDADITANLERVDTPAASYLGTGMSQSSGIFTFPSTGYWIIMVHALFECASENTVKVNIQVTLNNSSYAIQAIIGNGQRHSNATTTTASGQLFLDVTSTTNVKIKFTTASLGSGSILKGSTDATANFSDFMFIRLGDT